MNTKHTPGPWIAQRDPNAIMADDWCIGAQGQIDSVAVCSERDARLIAAAPDLLEALKCLVGWFDDDRMNGAEKQIKKARAAIRKATGENQ